MYAPKYDVEMYINPIMISNLLKLSMYEWYTYYTFPPITQLFFPLLSCFPQTYESFFKVTNLVTDVIRHLVTLHISACGV